MKHPVANQDVGPDQALPFGMWQATDIDWQAEGARPSKLAARYRAYVMPLLYALSAIKNWSILSVLWNAPSESLLGLMLQARPEIWRMLRVRFVSARWSTKERLTRIVGHCDLAARLGPPFAIRPQERAIMLTVPELGPDARIVLDSPRWLLREGLLALSLMDGADRIFSLSFTLAEEKGRRIAYVGGIQGRRAPDALDRNRTMTRAAAGARPQDLLVELFRAICASIGVTLILCVSDRIRNGQTAFANHDRPGGDPVTFDYDALWRERGGVLRKDGFYDLAVHPEVRDDSDLPSKKRAARRKKLAFVGMLQDRLALALSRPRRIRIEQTEPV